MVKLTKSLQVFLYKFYPDLLSLILFGHAELFTGEIQAEYIEWLKTDEGKSYLVRSKADEKAERGSSLKSGASGSSPIKMEWSKWIEMRFGALY